MTKFFPTLAALAIAMTPALAMGATEVDADGDGMLTLQEVQAVYPDMSEERFSTIDSNSNGALDDAEVAAAQEAGLMEAPAD